MSYKLNHLTGINLCMYVLLIYMAAYMRLYSIQTHALSEHPMPSDRQVGCHEYTPETWVINVPAVEIANNVLLGSSHYKRMSTVATSSA